MPIPVVTAAEIHVSIKTGASAANQRTLAEMLAGVNPDRTGAGWASYGRP